MSPSRRALSSAAAAAAGGGGRALVRLGGLPLRSRAAPPSSWSSSSSSSSSSRSSGPILSTPLAVLAVASAASAAALLSRAGDGEGDGDGDGRSQRRGPPGSIPLPASPSSPPPPSSPFRVPAAPAFAVVVGVGPGHDRRCRCEGREAIVPYRTDETTVSEDSGGKGEGKKGGERPTTDLSRHPTSLALTSAATTSYTASSRYAIDPDPIGTGSFGTVHRGTDRYTGEDVALKFIPKEYTDDASFRRETDALLRVRRSGGHPHICGLRENFDEPDRYLLVLDFVGGGEMFDRLVERGSYSELDASRLVREVACALDFLHGIGVVHGDLKPENLMLSSKRGDAVVKIVDFGSAEVSPDGFDFSETSGGGGGGGGGGGPTGRGGGISGDDDDGGGRSYGYTSTTPAYCPPEVLDDPGTCPVLPSLDMWAMGIILHVMLTGMHPFDLRCDSDDDGIAERIRERRGPDLNPALPHLRHLSPAAIDLMRRLTSERPEDRLTAHEMLSHPWVTGRLAGRDAMEGVSERLAGMRGTIERRVLEDLLDISQDEGMGSGGGKRSTLLEMAFRTFDRQGKGFVTPEDVEDVERGGGGGGGEGGGGGGGADESSTAAAAAAASSSSDGGTGAGPSLTLTDFADLLSQSMKSRYYPRGRVIYEQGDAGHHMYFIDSGTVEVRTRDGFRTTLGPGRSFGEGAMLSPDGGGVRRATIRCRTPVHAIEIDRERFYRYLRESSRSQEMHINLRERAKMHDFGRAGAILGQHRNLREVRLGRGETIYEEGDVGDAAYVLDEGIMDVRVEGKTAFALGPGELFGLNSLLFGCPRRCTAACVSEGGCAVRALSSRDFQSLLDSSPSVKDSLHELGLRRNFRRALVLRTGRSFPTSTDELRDAFDAVDGDGSGALDIDEVRELLRLLDDSISEDRIRETLRSLDLDDSGCVDFDEFRRVFGMGGVGGGGVRGGDDRRPRPAGGGAAAAASGPR